MCLLRRRPRNRDPDAQQGWYPGLCGRGARGAGAPAGRVEPTGTCGADARGGRRGRGEPVSCCCRDKWRHDEWWNAAHLVSYSSGGQKSKVGPAGLKSRCWQGCAPSGGSKREEFSSLSLFEGPRAPAGSWPPPSVFKASIFRVPLTLPLAVRSHSRTFLRTLEIMLGSSR